MKCDECGEIHPVCYCDEKPKSSASERPVNEEPMSNCCNSHFTYPGWPDSDLCSNCFEHADLGDNNA